MKKLFFLLAILLSALQLKAQDTYLFAQRDTCSLYLDVFDVTPGAETTCQGVEKPAVLFVFGGGFVSGERATDSSVEWFKILNDNGYPVVTIDYRLGMKGYKVKKGLSGLLKAADRFKLAQDVAVEDVYSAVAFLVENGEEIGINPDNLVIAGSSAGAITALAAEYGIVNRTPAAAVLPEGFNFKGVMSFAGGIMSDDGAPRFKAKPCPVLFLHGTADKAVAYNKVGTLRKGLWGSNYLARQLDKLGADYCIYRFTDRTHDVAAYMQACWSLEKDFLEKNVVQGARRVVDATIDDSSLPSLGNLSTDDIY